MKRATVDYLLDGVMTHDTVTAEVISAGIHPGGRGYVKTAVEDRLYAYVQRIVVEHNVAPGGGGRG